VAEHQPGAAEDALQLELEDPRIGVHRAVHAIGLHEKRQALAIKRTHSRYGKGNA
jgi:hypothetical protein